MDIHPAYLLLISAAIGGIVGSIARGRPGWGAILGMIGGPIGWGVLLVFFSDVRKDTV